jgi:hypothetical protein
MAPQLEALTLMWPTGPDENRETLQSRQPTFRKTYVPGSFGKRAYIVAVTALRTVGRYPETYCGIPQS